MWYLKPAFQYLVLNHSFCSQLPLSFPVYSFPQSTARISNSCFLLFCLSIYNPLLLTTLLMETSIPRLFFVLWCYSYLFVCLFNFLPPFYLILISIRSLLPVTVCFFINTSY
jgi:hypothetical protein